MTPSSQRAPSLVRRALGLFNVLLRAMGWLAWVLLLCALVMSGSRFGQRELEGLLRRRLDPLGSSISLEGVRFDWLGPGLTVEGLRVKRDGREHLYLHNIYVSAHFSLAEGVRLDRIDIDQGRLLITEQAIDDVRALIHAGENPGAGWPANLPAVEVREFELEFQAPGQAAARLGQIELSMRAPEGGYSRIQGRVVLPTTPGTHKSPELYLSGLIDSRGLLEMHTIVQGFEIGSWDLPALPAFDVLRSLHPRGRVSLHTTGSVQLSGELAAKGEIRLRVERGALNIPGTPEPVQALQVAFQAAFEPQVDEDFWTPRAWTGGGQLSARWDAQQLEAGVRVGRATRPGRVLETWARAPQLLVNTPALAAMTSPIFLPTLFGALDPRGVVKLHFALAVPESVHTPQELGSGLEYVVRVENLETLSAAYHGWPDALKPHEEPMGFALPAQVDSARVVFAHTPRFPRQDILDVRFAGRHATGPLRGSFQSWPNPIDMPPFARGYGLHESDMFIEIPRLALDHEVERHLPELYALPNVVRLFDDYGLSGGTVGVDLRICGRMKLPVPALDIKVQVHNVSATYVPLPVPAHAVEGLVQLISGGFGKTSISFDMHGSTLSAHSVALVGRVRSEGRTPNALMSAQRFSVFQLDVPDLDLQGPDLSSLAATSPEALEAVDEFGARGRVRVQLTQTGQHGTQSSIWTEVTPLGEHFEVIPQIFPMKAEGLQGRVLVEIESVGSPLDTVDDAPPTVHTRTRASPLLAHWRGGVPLAFKGLFDSQTASSGRVLGAALPGEDRQLLRDLLRAAQIEADPMLDDLRDVAVRGAIDFDYRFEIPAPGSEAIGGYDLHLRDLDVLRPGAYHASRLRGILSYAGERFSSERIDAQLGETQLSLTSIELTQDPLGFELQADLGTRRLPIKRDLVGQFMDAEATESLFGEFELRGTLDVEAAHVQLRVPKDSPIRIELQGHGTLSDAFLSLGLPVSISSAKVTLEDLVLEGDELRGWMRIEDLYGQAFERELARTNLLLSYHGSQVTVEELNGVFCRGRVHGLGADGTRNVAAPVLSLDLLPPNHFRAGLQFSDVDVRVLLEDVFGSGVADRGRLDAHVQLTGDLEHLLEIRGSGHARVSQTVLWSVPVLRDLFSQLGFDATAIFDSMQTGFEIANGSIRMEGMEVHSPILKLRGSGTMGFDGTLAHDLEVRYSLADKAWLFGDLIHWLQNQLLGISIRGDMSRPKVILSGLFSNPFTSLDEDWRGLPSPGYSELRPRF